MLQISLIRWTSLSQVDAGKVVPMVRERFSRRLVPDRDSCSLSGEREKVERGKEERREGRERGKEEGGREEKGIKGKRSQLYTSMLLYTCTCTQAGCM